MAAIGRCCCRDELVGAVKMLDGLGYKTAALLWIRRCTVPALLGIALLVSGCSSGNIKPVTQTEREALEAAASGPPKLQAGEKLHVTVYNEPSLSGDYQ